MKSLAIIPARSRSKRIPHKNIKDFCGKPIIAYSIETALGSGLFDEVMVSTDSVQIAEIALELGASVPFLRSEKNANDTAGIRAVIDEVLDSYKSLGKRFDEVCCIFATAPFLKEAHLAEARRMLAEKSASTVLTVSKFSAPILRSLNMKDGWLKMNWPEYLNTRSQDLDVAYFDAGMMYWINLERCPCGMPLFNEGSVGLPLGEMEVQDIDTPEDWLMAEYKYRYAFGENR